MHENNLNIINNSAEYSNNSGKIIQFPYLTQQ